MFCPKCSQQQSAEEVRFCPRCGFALGGVRELLAGGGIPSMLAGQQQPTAAVSGRQRGIRLGARLLLMSVVLFPLIFGVCLIFGSPIPFVVPGTLFLGGLAWMVYARLFGESFLPTLEQAVGARMGRPAAADYALPPAARALGPQQAHTAEMMHPPAVTDHTTNLLDRRT